MNFLTFIEKHFCNYKEIYCKGNEEASIDEIFPHKWKLRRWITDKYGKNLSKCAYAKYKSVLKMLKMYIILINAVGIRYGTPKNFV